MKDYFLEIVKDGQRVDVAHVQANNQEQANALVTNAAIGRKLENFSVREVTEAEFKAFAESKAAEEKPADPEKPKATVSINGGDKIDAASPEAQKAIADAAAQLAAEGGEIFVSFDGGPELPINSAEAEDAFNALAPDADHDILIVAKQPVNDEPPAPGTEGNADSAQSGDAGNTSENTPPAEGTESAAAA